MSKTEAKCNECGEWYDYEENLKCPDCGVHN